MKTKLITTIITSLLVASSPICSANPARSLINAGKVIIKVVGPKVAKAPKKIRTSPTLPKAPTPSAPSGGSSPWLPQAARVTGQVIKNRDKNRNNSEEN